LIPSKKESFSNFGVFNSIFFFQIIVGHLNIFMHRNPEPKMKTKEEKKKPINKNPTPGLPARQIIQIFIFLGGGCWWAARFSR
jgi:hypothetical protein